MSRDNRFAILHIIKIFCRTCTYLLLYPCLTETCVHFSICHSQKARKANHPHWIHLLPYNEKIPIQIKCIYTWHGSHSRRFWSSLNLVPPTSVCTPMPSWYFNNTLASAAIWLASSRVGQRMSTSIGGTLWALFLREAFRTVSMAGSCWPLIEVIKEQGSEICK